MPTDRDHLRHLEWLGYLQPVGLVVSPPALAEAMAFPNANIIADQNRFLECVEEVSVTGKDDPVPAITDFPRFCTHVLGWRPGDLAGTLEGGPLPDALESTLTEYNETLRPTYAVAHPDPPSEGRSPWMMLVKAIPKGSDPDKVVEADGHHWQASPQARFERLLRDTQTPIGLLVNGTHLRLVYTPKGESSGHLTFPVQAMTEVAGRPIFAALRMLLGEDRLFALPDEQRLPAILAKSRKYQNEVSTKLAEQVLAALYELLRGLQAADDSQHGILLREVIEQDPNQVYAGLLTVLLRFVFLLFAEDRGLMSDPQDEVYPRFYGLIGLYERLRADAGRYQDTMDHRYGAWAQLLTLFRLVHDGAHHGRFSIPPRRGYLFDPDKYPFLEGRTPGDQSIVTPDDTQGPPPRTRRVRATVDPPRVSDGVVFRVLQNLLILDGERLSYRTLDVEQIGSVYETIMGFNLEIARGRSIAVKPAKPHGAPTTVNLEELLTLKPAERAAWLKAQTDQTLPAPGVAALKVATTPEEAVAALGRKVAEAATPRIVPPGAMVLQPSDERRRSGSHYTPRTLTEPIVATTLRPILERLGPNPTPEQILDLKLCDPAMGSGAFLVALCRLLAEWLIKAWHNHGRTPRIPPDETDEIYAQRQIAQRCLYGVDRNPMAVDLAKLSLWLATLAKDHPFTFLDHALKCGDSLVGLSRAQILGFHWKPEQQRDFARGAIEGQLDRAMDRRRQIREAPEGTPETQLAEQLKAADGFLEPARRYGDLVVSAFFAGSNDRQRKDRLQQLADDLAAQQKQFDADRHVRLEAARHALRHGDKAVVPFHWEIEFPEVFDRENPGFDAFVGNPPFMGGSRISSSSGACYLDWLLTIHEESHGNGDLVAHFFRRAFNLLRRDGAFGMIATNTIGQGDTRTTGLRWIGNHGGTIYEATRRVKWPGLAAVVVSVVHVARRMAGGPYRLDRREVPIVTAYLFHAGGHDDPAKLRANAGKTFMGSKIYGQGFTFDDSDTKGGASPIAEMQRLIAKDPRNGERIFPYIGGEEVNDSPIHVHSRYVINFGQLSLEEAEQWPDLIRMVRERVKPERDRLREDTGPGAHGKKWWWQFQHPRQPLYAAIAGLERVLVISQVTSHVQFAFLPARMVFSHALNVFPLTTYAAFCVLQSRPHEVWARFFASSLEDRLRYTPSDCYETFPFPSDLKTNPSLESSGRAYYEFRADLMVRNNEGLTKTYNRFHDPDERSPEIVRLRDLHAAMDRAVLDAYGWTDLAPTCEFLLDYEDDEDDDSSSGRRRKKPWRYRWPDPFRDEVLARLLDLNRLRAEQEALSGAAAEGKAKKPRKTARTKPEAEEPRLF